MNEKHISALLARVDNLAYRLAEVQAQTTMNTNLLLRILEGKKEIDKKQFESLYLAAREKFKTETKELLDKIDKTNDSIFD